jgi:hypothetical protein
MGETRVDLLHLLEDLADAYPGDLEETVLTEIVANALDSGASVIIIQTDASTATFALIDDGAGMRRAELRRFHDVAASAKTRGEGIGFAGVGIKLGLLVSEEVVTETRRGKEHIATSWALVKRQRAPWHWVTPTGLVVERGTAVRLRLENPLSPLLDPGYLEATLRRHFEPLFDEYFDDMLRDHYPRGVAFEINGQLVAKRSASIEVPREVAPLSVRLARKRKPSAVGYLIREPATIAEERRGIAISTFGKVIKRGWDWLGMSPASADRVSGLIEVPSLSASLTLNKGDFLRAGQRGATYLAYRRALQEAVAEQLASWGDVHDDQGRAHRRAARPVERDVERVLLDLANDFPLLAMLVQRRAGGQRKLPVGRENGRLVDDVPDLFSPGPGVEPPIDDTTPAERPEPEEHPEAVRSDRQTPESVMQPTELPARRGPRRPTRLGLTIQFETRPDLLTLGRLVETTVWVNDAHPAYRRAAASRSEGYHLALSVAMALASVAVEPVQANAFVTGFLARWGESIDPRTKRRRGRGSSSRRS